MGEVNEEKKGSGGGGGGGGNKEGTNLLGPPTFSELPNGRLKCVETGHEMVVKDKETYSQSKRCRLGMIEFALSHSKPPLNMFKQDPLSRSKLICKLTGHTINKSEEHIWKHINGKRFLNKLEQKEMAEELTDGTMAEESKKKPKKEKKKKKKKKKEKEKAVEEVISEVRDPAENESESEELEFWIPPVGERWDFDDGGDRWGSGSEPDESDDENKPEAVDEEQGKESEELSTRSKRMSTEIGPSSFASRKKKKKSRKTEAKLPYAIQK